MDHLFVDTRTWKAYNLDSELFIPVTTKAHTKSAINDIF